LLVVRLAVGYCIGQLDLSGAVPLNPGVIRLGGRVSCFNDDSWPSADSVDRRPCDMERLFRDWRFEL